jgi:acetylglutamate kinase
MDYLLDPDPEALPTAKAFIGRTVVVRVDSEAAQAPTLATDLLFMRRLGIRPLVVHDARERSTGARLVGMINRVGGDAVGLDGTSAGTIIAAVDEDGRVTIRTVNAQLMSLLLAQGYIPVFGAEGSAISGMPLPIDGDEAARLLAQATHAIRLLFPAHPGGIPSDTEGIIDELTSSEALALAAAGTLSDDLVRHLRAAAFGVRAGVEAAQLLDLSSQHASIVELLTAQHVGTQVVSNIVLSREVV